MNHELIPRQTSITSTQMPRALTRAVAHQRHEAALAAARVNRIAVTTQVALHRLAELSELEAQLIRMCPLGERRYSAIVDAATLGMSAVVHQQNQI
jgi:hypothetical protein